MGIDPLVLLIAGLAAGFVVGLVLLTWGLDSIIRDVKDTHRKEHERGRHRGA